MIVRCGNALTEPGLQAGPSQDRRGRRSMRSPPSGTPVYASPMSRVLVLAVLAVLAACGPAVVRAPGTGPERRPVADAFDSLAGPWTLRNAGRPRAQLVTLSAVLQSRVDSVVRHDTVASQTLLEWSAPPDVSPVRVVGMVRSFNVMLGSDSTWRPLQDLRLPVAFAATQPRPGAQPTFTTPVDTSCGAAAAVVQGLRETWLAPPSRLVPGTAWRDSSVYPLCRDGVLLEARVLRVFTVVEARIRDGTLVLRVRRESETVLAGRGIQFGDSITITGEGRASAMLDLSIDGAMVLAGEGSSELHMHLRGRRRTQDLVQHGTLVIRGP
jgi:hypothetical protein